MAGAQNDALKQFPHVVRIVDPHELLQKDLLGWETANESSQWRPGAATDFQHSWAVTPQAGWSGEREKAYHFRSAADASLFEREYGNATGDSSPWLKG